MADQPDSETSYIEIMDRHVKLIPQYGDGDGTVPMFSSQISGVTGTYYVPYQIGASSEHGALTDNSNVQKIVKSILDGKPSNYYTSYNEGATIDKDSTDFAVHSNVHTTIVDETTGNKLGYNSNGGIDEGIDGGTFLSMDGGTYAHISDASDTYKVILNGTNNGQFTLITNVTKSGQSTVFSYPSVPVQQGTIAQVEIAPNQVSSSNMPTLQVNTAGQTSSVSATSGLISPSVSSQTQTTSLQIPSWIKHNADWWSQGQIGDDDFIKGIQYLINHGIMVIPQSQTASQQSQQIPSWVKHNAGWWAQGQIGDDDFVKGIQFMISNGKEFSS
ncbi:hypothetical protein DYY66_2606 [Candidatus Nitrosotalea sp. FS]|nr:hypothetical protein [Candidatus Nitrosotalea sp. FS]